LDAKNAATELTSKNNRDGVAETKLFRNSKEEHEISLVETETASKKKQNKNENQDFVSNIKPQIQAQDLMSPLSESFSKRHKTTENSKFDLKRGKNKNANNSNNKASASASAYFKKDCISITNNNEEGIMLPVQDFYDEFNKEIVLTDYFSRFLALSIAIYEDEFPESNYTHYKNNNNSNFYNDSSYKRNSNVNSIFVTNSQQNQILNSNIKRSNILNNEIEQYDYMRKKANHDLTQNEKQEVNHQMNVSSNSNIVHNPKHRNSAKMQRTDNSILNREIQYTEFNKKNIPERFKSRRIGKIKKFYTTKTFLNFYFKKTFSLKLINSYIKVRLLFRLLFRF